VLTQGKDPKLFGSHDELKLRQVKALDVAVLAVALDSLRSDFVLLGVE
jgi:hypothetical protein